MMDIASLLGQNDQDIDYSSAEAPLHKGVVAAYLDLQRRAAAAGFDLAIASAYRSYERQLAIWNAKLSGARPVYDSQNQLLLLQGLSEWQQLQAVLRWSALPGASRHHWGTDIDIYDRAAVAPDYQLQLSLAEVSEGGPFNAMHNWLDELILAEPELGFFRPYDKDRGGVAPERWHISYAPLAAHYQKALTLTAIRQCCESGDMLLKETVLNNIDLIKNRFIDVPVDCYPENFQFILQ
ncbi:M15 family metallopeptidase [Dasania sp. GY-MA-18]|uniref:M15 family metallopeptidase n=1 Tax=Dasania phycosphaerae TaxID=2950436 RepID=A0A9J6RHA5_9GAMM|nr:MULTISPECIES: M15 family metallopeptidase [Dasania]MCR8921228.1 M15 family metallopeptidase [Dasania sp. GY-MA-18]MCZ0863656.1 M15 family metallopeptidase [Dasania phycosphaerae]MCZ0867384.1 M15 family metallopeptidase [Dasania phycosphaerae]